MGAGGERPGDGDPAKNTEPKPRVSPGSSALRSSLSASRVRLASTSAIWTGVPSAPTLALTRTGR